ncbi:MAG: adenosylmethionine decarboxylase, partial [Candidatus Coatesbacteria bacterium]
LKNIIIEAIKKSGAGIEGYVEKKFHPQGYSIAILISESHATIHTFPEADSLFVDFFTCGDVDPEPFRKYLLEHVPADEIYEDTVILRPLSDKK